MPETRTNLRPLRNPKETPNRGNLPRVLRTNDQRFVYDGWNLIAELNTNNSPLRTYTWGLDLSGTPQGAGGIGGLLLLCDVPSAICYSPAFDGNGNVSALINASDGTFAAQYERGPFGEVVRATGPMAKANPFRFSTKYQDDETDLLYYGYRYYSPNAGRWLNRDFLGDTWSLNSCARGKCPQDRASLASESLQPQSIYVQNNPAGRSDALGLSIAKTIQDIAHTAWCVQRPCCCAQVWDSDKIVGALMDEIRDSEGNPIGNEDDTKWNAVKHCTWMCYVSSKAFCWPPYARELGVAHEIDFSERNTLEKGMMDLWNNEVGLLMHAQGARGLRGCFDACKKAAEPPSIMWVINHKYDDM
jgi:RHS repeat-associated protein